LYVLPFVEYIFNAFSALMLLWYQE